MATQVAAARQPFAPLNGSRLQNLTSLKNRQNGTARPHLLHTLYPTTSLVPPLLLNQHHESHIVSYSIVRFLFAQQTQSFRLRG
jgi:hypothetical protein